MNGKMRQLISHNEQHSFGTERQHQVAALLIACGTTQKRQKH